jgi:Tfp pilus assembly protein PilN
VIKANLLVNVGGAKAQSIQAEVLTESVGELRKALPKLVLILISPLCLMIYEKIIINEIQGKIEAERASLVSLQAQRDKLGAAAPRIEKYTKEKQKIDKELDVVRGIARNRLKEVKTYDVLQSILPEKTWLKRIEIVDDRVQIIGYTMGEDGVQELMSALEGSAFFSQVEPKSTTQETLSIGVAKKFEIEFHVGKKD